MMRIDAGRKKTSGLLESVIMPSGMFCGHCKPARRRSLQRFTMRFLQRSKDGAEQSNAAAQAPESQTDVMCRARTARQRSPW
jgi:hypothetical protein